MTPDEAGLRQRRAGVADGKRGVRIAAVGVAIVLGLAGCSGNPSATSPSQTPSPTQSSDAPAVDGLSHVAIKTNDLTATLAFYTKVIGLVSVSRPDFGFPGAWLGVPGPGGKAIVHIYAGGPALGSEGATALGSGAIDHVTLSCHDYHGFIDRIKAAGLSWREFLVPGTTTWQLFVFDPSGVQLELSFDGSTETGPPPDLSPGRGYIAGANFFDPATYPKLS
jgi:catechol 2,3-dioxygenase-like lactoylglutathione lyase family enzyme